MHAYQLQQEVCALGGVLGQWANISRNGGGGGFVGPTSPPPPPPPPPTVAPTVALSKPYRWPGLTYTPPPRPVGFTTMPPVPVSTVPFFDPARAFTYTREQLREMKDEVRAAEIKRERAAASGTDPNATEQPTSDSAGGAAGAARKPTVSPIAAQTKPDAGPLAIAALLAYLFMM